MRKMTRRIKIGNIFIGGEENIAIQSMTNTKTENINDTIKQIKELETMDCNIIRVAVPNIEAALAIKKIKREIKIPLVADIHFDHRLAIKSILYGADKIRINPGNIGDKDKIKKIISVAGEKDIPVRIGINSGSLDKEVLKKYGSPCSDAMVESALTSIELLESMGFYKIVLSLKSSDVIETINSYKKLSKYTDYPLHIGITESGTVKGGTIRSAVGIGILLNEGIGDTIRVSLTGNPKEEIIVAKEILKSLKLLTGGIEIISCPTCGRCNVDLIKIANKIENKINLLNTTKNIKVAIMGCVVNGPGEAKDADLGIAGGRGEFLIFIKGKPVKKIPENDAISVFMHELKKIL